MPGCIEKLLAQLFGNFYGFKDLNRSPLEDRVQSLVHFHFVTSMLPLQHRYVAIATYNCCCGNMGRWPTTRGNCQAAQNRYSIRRPRQSRLSLRSPTTVV